MSFNRLPAAAASLTHTRPTTQTAGPTTNSIHSSIRSSATSAATAIAPLATSSAIARPIQSTTHATGVASISSNSNSKSNPSTSPAERLILLRAQRDQLKVDVVHKTETIETLERELADLRLSLATENDTLGGLTESYQLDSSKSILIQAFLRERKQTNLVWHEYLARLKKSARLNDFHQKSQTGTAPQFFSRDPVDDDETLTSSQRALRTALAAVQTSFQQNLQTAKELDENDPSSSTEYLKLTPDNVSNQPELRHLYALDDPSNRHQFHPATFISDLNSEVERGIRQIQQRLQELEVQRAKAAAKAAESASAPAPSDGSSNAPSGSTNAPPSLTSIETTFSNLISSLQSESTTRFVQAQKLANETESLHVILNELQDKQREKDASILDSNRVTFEQKQTLQAVRRLQNLQLNFAALKSQMAFAKKTYDTFHEIMLQRQKAMNTFVEQRASIDSFQFERKRNEKRMVTLVMENKDLRKKMKEYQERIMNMIQVEIQPICHKLSATAEECIDSIQHEFHQGLACMVSPLSLLEAGREVGGPGRVPCSRLALHQVQHPSLQNIQLHALIQDPFGSAGAVTKNATFNGLCGMKLYKNPTEIISYIHKLIQQVVHLSTLHRTSTTAHQALLHLASTSSFNYTSSRAWSDLHQRVAQFQSMKANEFTRILREVLDQATRTIDISLPRLQQLLLTFWSQPAQTCIPHLRNQHGYNIGDYVQQVRTLVTQIHQQEGRYNRALKHRLTQPL